MPLTIIIVALIASIIVVCVFYYKEILSFIKSKLSKKKSKKQEKPKPSKKVTPTVEDFKPIIKNYEEEVRDNSIQELFKDDEFGYEMDDEFDLSSEENFNMPDLSAFKKQSQSMEFDESDFEEFGKMFRTGEKTKDSKTIAAKIKNLPPEIKVMLIDNFLKKRDDI